MGHLFTAGNARIIAASIGLAIVVPPMAAVPQTGSQPTAQPSQTSAQLSALFVDCSGNYAQVSTTSGSVERQGRVQRLAGAHLPPAARDGCAVDDVDSDSPSRVVLTVQNFMWESQKRRPAYSRLILQLPDFRILKREPFRKRPSSNARHPEPSPIQRAFIESFQHRPFVSQAIMLSSDGRTALLAELTPASSSASPLVGPPSVFVPEMRITSALRMSLTGRFALYDIATKSERTRYEIQGLQTDLFSKTLLAPDGSFAFHAHNDSAGKRKLFLVKFSAGVVKPSPAAEVVEVAYGDLDPWWIGGVIVSAPGGAMH